MSRKQTAEEFVMDFKIDHTVPYIMAKKCALVAIDKMLDCTKDCGRDCSNDNDSEFLQELKQEIEKL